MAVTSQRLLARVEEVATGFSDWQYQKEEQIRQLRQTWRKAMQEPMLEAEMNELRGLFKQIQRLQGEGPSAEVDAHEVPEGALAQQSEFVAAPEPNEVSFEEWRWEWMQYRNSTQDLQSLLRTVSTVSSETAAVSHAPEPTKPKRRRLKQCE